MNKQVIKQTIMQTILFAFPLIIISTVGLGTFSMIDNCDDPDLTWESEKQYKDCKASLQQTQLQSYVIPVIMTPIIFALVYLKNKKQFKESG